MGFRSNDRDKGLRKALWGKRNSVSKSVEAQMKKAWNGGIIC